MEPIYDYTIKLIRYVLNGDIPELPQDIDFELLFAFSKSHGVENMLYVGLRDLKIDVPADTMKKFQTAYEMQIMVEATQALELEAIGEAFEKAGIDYVPLKGSVIKYLYPTPDLRKSGDIDILIKPGEISRIKAIMCENGYIEEEFDKVNLHVSYRKPPFMLVEAHYRLVEIENRSFEHYSHIWDRLQLTGGYKYKYEMDIETFYVYIVAHLCKHIKNKGAGIKFITDLWILLKTYSNKFNREKLNAELKSAKIETFEEWARKLALMWFDGIVTDDENVSVLEKFILESGCFGTVKNYKELRASEIAENTEALKKYKIKKLFFNIFLPYRELKKQYPVLMKHKYLVPYFWCARILRALIKDKRSVSEMVESSVNIDANNAKKLKKLWNAVN